MRPIRPVTKSGNDETLHARYAELLRLREYVQRLENACHDPAERRATVKRYEFENGRRFSQPFAASGD